MRFSREILFFSAERTIVSLNISRRADKSIRATTSRPSRIFVVASSLGVTSLERTFTSGADARRSKSEDHFYFGVHQGTPRECAENLPLAAGWPPFDAHERGGLNNDDRDVSASLEWREKKVGARSMDQIDLGEISGLALVSSERAVRGGGGEGEGEKKETPQIDLKR